MEDLIIITRILCAKILRYWNFAVKLINSYIIDDSEKVMVAIILNCCCFYEKNMILRNNIRLKKYIKLS